MEEMCHPKNGFEEEEKAAEGLSMKNGHQSKM